MIANINMMLNVFVFLFKNMDGICLHSNLEIWIHISIAGVECLQLLVFVYPFIFWA